ncbi:putative inorganic carbon transporter subunit DabA [Thioalkalicoccus limnaeus]|uniref:Inorganic carbon transporter subunit DabA n=1 Tax=Thioalkalicoccus limnaeus TaxID=120681 RepID=A0ABV4BN29_9GAMM
MTGHVIDSATAAGGARAPANRGEAHRDLGRELKIRSTVAIAGEFLPFVWPMRNFINHNPLHGLEDRPFDEAVEQATRLFHAQGYLRRTEYQALLQEGHIDIEVIEQLIDEFLTDGALGGPWPDDDADLDLKRILVTLMTLMDQPTLGGNAIPSTDALLAELRPTTE